MGRVIYRKGTGRYGTISFENRNFNGERRATKIFVEKLSSRFRSFTALDLYFVFQSLINITNSEISVFSFSVGVIAIGFYCYLVFTFFFVL